MLAMYGLPFRKLFSEIVIYALILVMSSGILKVRQKLGVTFNSDKLGVIDFTKFSKLSVKSMPPSLSELKVIPSFCFAFKIPDDVTASTVYQQRGDGEFSWTVNSCGHFFSKWVNSSGHFLRVNSRGHFLSTRIPLLG